MSIPNSSVVGFAVRIRELEAKRYDLKQDIDEIYSEAHEAGHNKRALRDAIKRVNAYERDSAAAARHAYAVEGYVAEISSQLELGLDFANAPSLQVDEPVYDSHPPFIGVHAVGAK